MSKYTGINFVPPKNVADEAVKGLEYREKAGGKGGLGRSEAKKQGIGSGVQRAVNLKNRDKLSPETVRRMKAFFDRHKKNKAIDSKHKGEPWKDRGYVAWLLWGGDPGYAWSKKIVAQMERADKRKEAADRVVLRYLCAAEEDTVDKMLADRLRAFVEETGDDWNYITPEQYQKLREQGKDKKFFLLDIRRPEDFKKRHIKGAENIFWMDLLKPENLKKLPKDKTILLYCYVGHTSSQALVLLKLLGYDVVSLKFGMGLSPVEGVPVAGWTDFGFETVKGKDDE